MYYLYDGVKERQKQQRKTEATKKKIGDHSQRRKNHDV